MPYHWLPRKKKIISLYFGGTIKISNELQVETDRLKHLTLEAAKHKIRCTAIGSKQKARRKSDHNTSK